MIGGMGIGDAWLVVFSDLDPIPPEDWLRVKRRDRVLYRLLGLLKPGFRHVWAMKRAEYFNGWLVLNVLSGGVHVFEVADATPVHVGGRSFADYHAFLRAMEGTGRAHMIVAPVQPGTHWRFRGILSCVSAIKHTLGVEAPWVWTPWQLYRHLSRQVR